MSDAFVILLGVLVCWAAVRVWIGYRLGELRHVKRRARPH